MPKKAQIIFLIFGLLIGTTFINFFNSTAAEKCPNLRLVFLRGSGETWRENESFLAFKNTLEEKLAKTSLSYEFIDLKYPAIAIGLDHPFISLGALFSGGESYKFGDSVNTGVEMLTYLVNYSCLNTAYVLGGYSQGAMTISKALPNLNPNNIIYAATFGDPKLYLPEGAGLFPDACENKNISPYRIYVPDCHAFEGLLGSYRPYVPTNFFDKVGTWCNKQDIMCSSGLSIGDHTAYVSDYLYDDASKLIFDKITAFFHIDNTFIAAHDTAILIDSTGSMRSMIAAYKAEALRLAKETLDSGGRVALYDYRDLIDPYEAQQHCNFETCTLEVFTQELNKINVDNGNDAPESLLASALKVMHELNWQYGTTKSLIVLTDATYLSPDRDGTTLEEVVALSRKIDPVNFYIVTNKSNGDYYQELTELTNGKIETDFSSLSLLTDFIMKRYDSLPKVELTDTPLGIATLTNLNYTKNFVKNTLQITFETDADQVLVVFNDLILGVTDQTNITIQDIDFTKDNIVHFVPFKNNTKSPATTIHVPKNLTLLHTPLVPDTGQI